MKHYAMVGAASHELITYQGKVLVHEDRGELEFIMAGVKVIECPDSVPWENRYPIRLHPDLASYQWPLKKSDFR